MILFQRQNETVLKVVYVQECHPVFDEKCTTNYHKHCKTNEKCTDIYQTVCQTQYGYQQECQQVPKSYSIESADCAIFQDGGNSKWRKSCLNVIFRFLPKPAILRQFAIIHHRLKFKN